MTIKTGTVKFYNAAKRYGFIQLAEGGDIFFHITDLANDGNDPMQGDSVSFVRSASRDGRPRAINVTVMANVS
jgi:CspA family cold shock protein